MDFGESFEEACLREISEEVGLFSQQMTLENCPDEAIHCPQDSYKVLLSNTPSNSINHVEAQFSPYYLYESVTKNITDIDDHQNEKFPPKSQHLVLFFILQLKQNYKRI